MSSTASLPVAIESWRAVRKGSLRGFAAVRIGRSLIVCDVTINQSNGKTWAGLPSKPVLNRDGTPRLGDNGKQMYSPIIKWDGRDAQDRFSDAVVAAIRAEHSSDLD